MWIHCKVLVNRSLLPLATGMHLYRFDCIRVITHWAMPGLERPTNTVRYTRYRMMVGASAGSNNLTELTRPASATAAVLVELRRFVPPLLTPAAQERLKRAELTIRTHFDSACSPSFPLCLQLEPLGKHQIRHI